MEKPNSYERQDYQHLQEPFTFQDFLQSMPNGRPCRVWMIVTESHCLNGVFYCGRTAENYVHFGNRWGCDVYSPKIDSPCRVENCLFKQAPVGYSLRTLSGAEDSVKELAYTRVFLGMRHNSEGCSQYLAHLFRANLLKIGIKKSCKNQYILKLQTSSCFRPHFAHNSQF